jgi:hypothetical protein
MALNSTKYFSKLPRKVRVSIDNTADPGVSVVANSGTDPSRVVSLYLLGDSSDRTIEVRWHDGSAGYLIFVGTLLANAGRTTNNPALELIASGKAAGLEQVDGKFVFDLPNGHSIRIRTTASPSATVDAVATVKDFAV